MEEDKFQNDHYNVQYSKMLKKLVHTNKKREEWMCVQTFKYLKTIEVFMCFYISEHYKYKQQGSAIKYSISASTYARARTVH